ncbi:MAG: hypothetical protein JW716_01690 [Candidatus Aenigmarchaeota archaeon]|nr:hypothetical protein [Candidatus Aenigmarchaeota archaeon]
MPSFFDEKIKALRKDAEKREGEKRIPYTDAYLDVGGGIGGPGGKVGENLLVYREGLLGEDNMKGEYVVGKTEMDQVCVINPDCLPGQAEIIYLIFLYRLVKWHFIPLKADEWMEMNPIHVPPFFTMLATKEKLEQHIKQGLNQVTQANADYELFKSDLRKYDEILRYFYDSEKKDKDGKKSNEHVLRSLFVDRVDAHTGEGYSMISMARRWPTIITDFIRLKSEDADDVDKLRESLKISLAEATVLVTKNRIYDHWKTYFFDDLMDRYARIKNLMESQEKQLNEYSNWLKPYINRYKRIRERSEVNTSFFLDNAQVFGYTPFSGLRARMWYYRGFEPEDMGKSFEEIKDPIDNFVLRWARQLEKYYGISFVREYGTKDDKDDEYDYDNLKRAIKKYFEGLSKSKDYTHEMVKYSTVFDKRYKYFAFYDVYYEADYMKGSQGPLEMEDIYYHIFPYVVSANVLLVLHLELAAKNLRFERYVNKLIGTRETEAELKKEMEDVFKDMKKDDKKIEKEWKEKKKKQEKKEGNIIKRWRKKYRVWCIEKGKGYKTIDHIAKFLRKKGPYERMVKERFSKEYATPLGKQTIYIYDLLKETCYKMSGVAP